MNERTIVFAVAAAVLAAVCAIPAAAGLRDHDTLVAFTRYDQTTGDPHIVVTTPNGGHERSLPLPWPADDATWSPDERKLMVTTFRPFPPGIRPAIVNPDGSGLHVLEMPELSRDTEVGCKAWSPDGRRLLCQVIGDSDHSIDGVYSFRASDGGDPRRLTVNPYPPQGDFGGGDIPGGYSPSGRQFVFMRAKPGPDPSQADVGQSGSLYVENTDGTNLHQIAPYGVPNSHDNGVPRWSPDGRWILFAGADFTLQLIHPDGSSQHSIPITDPAGRTFAFTPGWSPDGDRIIFSLYLPSANQEDIYTIRLDGSRLTPITNTPDFEDFANWAGRD
jgi:Tol biopolymer transport system component